MRPTAFGKAALVALLVFLPAGARADFDDAVRAHEAGDYATAYAEWLPLAERGDPAAERNIGHLYRMGWSVPQDFEEAAKWYRRAAEKGFARAQANLANMYLRGQGVERNHTMAVEWFRRAGLQGHAVAQYNLGLMYENGLGVEHSDAKAMGWYHLASRTGHRRASDKLALLIAKSTSELGTLVEAPVAETTAAVAETTEDIAALGEAAGAAAQPVEPVEGVARQPIEPAEVVELGPVEPLETTPVEPNEVAVTKPGIVVQAAEPEGPRRDPVEVVLDERAPDRDVEAALEMANIEPAAGADVATPQAEIVAMAPAEGTEVAASATDQEARGFDASASDLVPTTAPATASADAGAVAPGVEDEPSFFGAFLSALKGQRQREGEELVDADPFEAAPVAEDIAGSETTAPREVAESDAGGAGATVDGADPTEEAREGLDEPNVEPEIARPSPIERVGAVDEAPLATVAALIAVEPEVATEVEEVVEMSPAEPDEPGPEAPATAGSADRAGADELDEDDVAEDDGAAEEEERSFVVALLDALKGESRREREARAEAAQPAVASDDEGSATEEMVAASDAASPPGETELEPMGHEEDEGLAAPRVDARELADLARDAQRGEAQTAPVPPVDDATTDAERPTNVDEDAGIVPAAGELPIDWVVSEAPTFGDLTADEGPSETVEAAIDGAEAEEHEDAADADEGGQIAAVTATEEGTGETAEPPIDWDETGEPNEAAAGVTEPPPPVPPVEVAARGDSSAAPPVVAAALGAGSDLEGLSNSERLNAGLAAYRARDYPGAVIAWLPLAERGNRMAQFYVGGLYLDGTGLPPSRVWAHVFWTLAAEQGQEAADQLLAVLTADMLPVERAEARDLVAAWRPRR